jgi:hypothetical protein
MEELNTTTLEAVMEAVIQKDIPMDYGPWKTFSKEVRVPCPVSLACTAFQSVEHCWGLSPSEVWQLMSSNACQAPIWCGVVRHRVL